MSPTVLSVARLLFHWSSVCYCRPGASRSACWFSFTVWRKVHCYPHPSATNLKPFSHQMPKTRAALFILAAYIFVGYVVIQVCYYAVLCTPFHQYYALPVDNPECATYANYSKIQMVFNISSDLFIIVLPISILWRSKLPMKRKFVLMGLFSLGLFTILSAILNKSVFSPFLGDITHILQILQFCQPWNYCLPALVHPWGFRCHVGW